MSLKVSMANAAVGTYLRTLREARRLTREALADMVGTSVSQLVRIEAGEQDTRGSLLARIIAAVRGSAADVQSLLINPDASESDGQRLAQATLDGVRAAGLTADELQSPEDVEMLMQFLREELSGYPLEERRRIESAVQGLLAGFRIGRSESAARPPGTSDERE